MTPRGLRILMAGVLAALACDEPTRIAAAGGMALQVSVRDVDPSVLDSGRVRVRGPTNRDVSAVPGAVITIDQLQPGSYSVALEGFIGDEVGFFGQTSGVTVVAGQTTPATVSFASFESAAPVFPDTAWIGTQVTVNIATVTGAASYRVEWSQDATFASGVTSASTATSSVQITVATYAVYYIRVRAVDPFQMVGVPGAATRLRVVQSGPARQLQFSGQPSSTAAGSVIAPAVAVTAQDSLGNTATSFTGDVTVAIGTNPGGGSLAGMTTASATAGIATFATLSIDGVGVGYTLVASSGTLTAAVSDPFEVTAGAGTQIALDAGDNQTATVNTAVAIPPSVIVRDAGNNPVAGVSVTFAVVSGGGSVTGANAATNASGIAAVGSWTLGTSAGTANNTLTATAAGLTGSPVTFTASASPGAATHLVFTGQPSDALARAMITPAVVVTARDAFGNTDTGFADVVSVAIATNPPGSGAVSGTTALAAVAGTATFANLSIDQAGAGYTLKAAASGLTAATSSPFDVTLQLMFTTQPSNTLAGTTISPAVRVTARDGLGSTASTFTGLIAVSIAGGTGSPGAVLSGTDSRAAVAGVATFSDLSIDMAGSGFRLTAQAAIAASATSSAFDVTLQLVFTVQPSTSPNWGTITPPVQVAARDGLDGTASGFTGPVTVEITSGTGTGGAALGGTRTVAAVDGVATFSNLSIDLPGTGYTLTATATGLAGDASVTFDITCSTDCWTARAPMPTARAGLGVEVVNDILYAVGGEGGYATHEAYDPGTDTWIPRAPLPTHRIYLAVGVINGILYAVGGRGVNATEGTVTAYDPVANTWTTKAPMPTPRYGLGVGVVNGILYAVGGTDDAGTTFATVEAYDPATNTWTTKASMPTPNRYLGVGVVNGVLYAVGGSNATQAVLAYDPATDSWSTRASLPIAHAGLDVGVINGVLYAVGGGLGPGDLPRAVQAYNPVADSWSQKASLPSRRNSLGVGVANGVLYAVGGYDDVELATVEAYRP